MEQLNPNDIDKLLGIEAQPVPLSQSLVKKVWDYKAGKYCGERLNRVDLLKEFTDEPSEVMKLGNWFEYKCTGMLNRDGSTPERLCTQSGKPTAKTKYIETQAEKFKKLVEKERIDIQSTGDVLTYIDHDLGFRLKGVLNVRAIIHGRMSILDIKSSGLIGNEWEEFGWHPGTFNQRDKLTIQVVAYKYLSWKVDGIRDIPFYFAIHSNTNDVDTAYWEVRLNDFDVAMGHLEDTLAGIADDIRNDSEYGFTPYPNVKDCSKCPVEGCVFRAETPEKTIVTIDGIYHNDADIGDL